MSWARFSQAASWSFVAKFLSALSTFVISVVQVRLLSGDDYGAFALVTTVVGYTSVFSILGLDQAILRFLPEFRARQDEGRCWWLINRAASVSIVGWTLVLAIGWAAKPLLEGFYGLRIAGLTLWGVAFSGSTVLNLVLTQTATGLYKTRLQALVVVTRFGVFCGSMYLSYLLQGGVIGALGALALADLAAVILYVVALRKWRRKSPTASKTDFAVNRIARYASAFLLVSLLVPLTGRQLEVMLLGRYVSELEVGFYNVASFLPDQLLGFFPLIAFGIGTVGATEVFVKDEERLGAIVQLYYKSLFAVIAPLIVGGVLFSDKVVELVYKQPSDVVGFLMALFFLLFGLQKINSPLYLIFRVKEMAWANFVLRLITLFVKLPLSLVLIAHYGLLGAVLSVSISYLVATIIGFLVIRFTFSFIQVPWSYIFKSFLVCVPCVALLPLKPTITSLPLLMLAMIMLIPLWVLGARILELVDVEQASLLLGSRIPFSNLVASILLGKRKDILLSQRDEVS